MRAHLLFEADTTDVLLAPFPVTWRKLRPVPSFGLALDEGKTRLIEFGRFPAMNRRRRGAQYPETFAVLGFTHDCGWTGAAGSW